MRQSMIEGLRQQIAPAPRIASRPREDQSIPNIPFLEQDDALFRRRVLQERGKQLREPRFVTANEVQEEARGRVDDIFSNLDVLRRILDRHEGVIQKRWLKKTKAQRQKILLSAWPGMCPNHRPNFEAVRRKTHQPGFASSDRSKNAFMWPDFNQEDLSKPRSLLVLLNARGRNQPCEFVQNDIGSCNVGYAVNAIEYAYLNRHSMMIRDRKDRETYAELLAFDSVEEGFELMQGLRSLPPGTGLVLLEIQQRIMQFLVGCCKEILHDSPIEQLMDAPLQPEPAISAPNETSAASLAEMRSEAPYRVPERTDFFWLKAIFNAKRTAAEDHVWSLREDPSYFVDAAKELMAHRYEHVQDARGRAHPNLQPSREILIWGPVICNVVASAKYYAEIWTKLCEILEDNEDTLTSSDPMDDLSEEAEFNLTYFKTTLQHTLRGPIGQLNAGLYSSPPLRHLFERPSVEGVRARRTGICALSAKQGSRRLEDSDNTAAYLVWLANVLVREGMDTQYGIVNIVDEFGRLIQNDKKAPKLTTAVSLLPLRMESCVIQDLYFTSHSDYSDVDEPSF